MTPRPTETSQASQGARAPGGPGPEDTRRAYRRYLHDQLARRLRMAALGLGLGSAVSLPLYLPAWPLLAGYIAFGTGLGLLPRRWARGMSPALSVAFGLVAVSASLLVPVEARLTTGVLIALVLTLLLPAGPITRAVQLATQGLLLLTALQPVSPWLAGSAVAVLGIAWVFGGLQERHWRSLWEDRATLEHLTSRLARERDRRGEAVAARERELLDQQDRMVQQEQWATLGRVAVGVGHEIKNPLQAAMSDVEAARRTGDLSALDDATEALERIATLLRDLSLLRGSPSGDTDAVDLGPLLQATVRGARMGLANLRVSIDPCEDVPVLVDQGRLVQVVANLLTNAWHACERRGHGRVRILPEVTAETVRLYVDDDGPGIPDELRERAFEAFVTTKRAGKGSGLGLPISRGLMRAMGGDLRIAPGSTLGGARFVIELERASQDVTRATIRMPRPTRPAEPAPARQPRPVIERRRRAPTRTAAASGHLLVIDDDPIVRRSVARLLGTRWSVQAVAGSAEARAILREKPVDVVLCDLNLISEDALDAIAVIRTVRPDLVQRTVFMSGEPTSSRLVALAQANPDRLMGKPFDLARGHALLVEARDGSLPWLELPDDIESVDPVAVLEPAWRLDAPTEEIVVRQVRPPATTPS